MSDKTEFKLTPSQKQASELYGCDLLISAGAGSGKTATLTRRIAERIIKGDDITKKLIVTFTKDAANELKARINGALAEVLQKNPENRHVCDQIVRLASADICTIDSFLVKIVRANFERVGINADFRVADEGEREVLCKEAISEVIDALYEQKGQNEDFLIVCDCFSSITSEELLQDRLLDLYRKLITTPDGIKTLLSSSELKGDFMDNPYGTQLRRALSSMLEHFIHFYDVAIEEIKLDTVASGALLSAFDSDRDFAIRLKNLALCGSYLQISDCIGAFAPLRRGSIKGECALDTDFMLEMRSEFTKCVRDMKKEYFSWSSEAIESVFKRNGRILLALYDILDRFEKEYQNRKRQAGVCDFNDITRYALDILYNEDDTVSDVAVGLCEAYEEIYVDEYQDTNLVQDKIFKAISKNNRFLVGDIKQSIYRFRSAEPEIFSDYRRAFSSVDEPGEGGKSIFMSENFRCDKGVIDFSNALTDYMLENSKGIPYQPQDRLIFAKKADYQSEIPEVLLVDSQTDEDDESLKDVKFEAEAVAEKIRELIDSGYLANGKKIEPCNIAILMRGFKNPVEAYTDALSRRGIPFTYKGEERFFEKSEILLVLCILNAIDNPLRDVYLAGAMHSCVFGFTLEELIKIRSASASASSFFVAVQSYKGESELEKKITEFLAELEKYRDLCRKKSSYEIISMIYSTTSVMSACTEGERRSLLKLYDMARGYESGAYKGLYSFLRYVEGIKESGGKEELGSFGEQSVRLMSIHASKGLEFEVCFLCGCGSRMNKSDASDPIMFNRHLGVCAYVGREKGLAKFNTIMRKCASLAIKRESVEEEMRILYVAMTRARSKLFISALCSDAPKKLAKSEKMSAFASEYSVLGARAYIDWVLGAISKNPSIADVHILNAQDINIAPVAETEQNSVLDRAKIDEIKEKLTKRLSFSYPYSHLEKIPSKLSVSRLYPRLLDAEENEETELDVSLDLTPSFISKGQAEPTGAQKGTATHVFMQFCDFDLLDKNGAEAELNRLREQGFISPALAELVNLEHIEKFRVSALFDELKSAKNILREFRFNVMLPASEFSEDERLSTESVLVQGVIDCIYENQSHQLVLVDYKTDFVTEKNYKAELLARHSSQLGYYKRACEMMLERKLDRVEIYSVPLAKTLELQ